MVSAMGRPINADADATRRRILGSALELFSGHGVDGVSIRDIARAADVSLGMVHHYYGSKDELYGACIAAMDAELRVLQAELEDELARGGALPDIVARGIVRGYRFACAHSVATRLLMRQVVESGELPSARREGMQMPFLARASALLGGALGRDPGELRLALQSLVSIVVRYAIGSDRELAQFAGTSDLAAARVAVERHLMDVATSLLAPRSPPAPSPRNEHAH